MPAPGPIGGLAACAEANTDICRFLCSRDLVILKRSQKSPDEKPCFLSLRCDPSGGEGVVSVGILSSARNMEVYLGEEYCGTSRGRSVGNVLDTRFVTHPCAASSRGGFPCPRSGSSASLTLASGTRGRSEKHQQPWEFRPWGRTPGQSGQPWCVSSWKRTAGGRELSWRGSQPVPGRGCFSV